jgi:hypothetical protein
MAPWDPSYPSPPSLFDLVRASAWAPPYLPSLRPIPSQIESSSQNQWQPSALGAAHGSNAQFVPFGGWPLPQTPSTPMSPPTFLAANDEAPTRPWGMPVSPMDAFNPWLRGAIDSMDKTIRHFRSRSGYGDDAMDSPDCMEEWRDAREQCARELSKPNPSRNITGGYEDIEDCARGLVSERCGGNPYERPRRR